MKITTAQLKQIIREEIVKMKAQLGEAKLDPKNEKLKKQYINAAVTLSIDPYAHDDYDSSLPTWDKIESHAKKYGWEKTLDTIEKRGDVENKRYSAQAQQGRDKLADKKPGSSVGNLMMRDPMQHLTKGGKMNKLDVQRLKMKIKKDLGLE